MADLRISELPVLLPGDVEAGDDLAVADYSSSETRKSTVKGVVQRAVSGLIDDGVIPGSKLVADSITAAQLAPNAVGASELADNSVDTAALVDGSVTGAKVAPGSISGSSLVPNSVTAVELAPNSVGASELADDAVDTAAIQNAAVTNAKVAAGIDGAKLLADSVTALQIAPNAVGAVELADNSVDTAAVIDGAVTDVKLAPGIDGAKLADGTITNVKLTAGIDGSKLAADSVTAVQLAPNSVSASELSDGAVDTAAIQDGVVTSAKLAADIDGAKLLADSVTALQIGPNAITASELSDLSVATAALQDSAVTDAKVAAGLNGAKLSDASVTDAKLAAGIDGAKLAAGSVTGTQLGAVTDRGLDQVGGKIGHTNTVTPGTRNGFTYDAEGHITGTAPLSPTDLPIATATAVGGVSVPASSGLSVTPAGALDHLSSITASSISGFTFDEHGHITGYRALTGADLPAASAISLGAVSVPAGSALQISGTGELGHADSTVAAGTYPKVTVDQRGHVTSGQALVESDIPELNANKITAGSFPSDRLADGSITKEKIGDYATAYIQDTQPPNSNVQHNGMLWLNPLAQQIRMWDGNVWVPIGVGALSEQNLRFCGLCTAVDGKITVLTQFGRDAGYKVGDTIPTATAQLTGSYFVVDTAGNGIAQSAGVTYDPGDWCVCLGVAEGWKRVDTLSGGGGGGTTVLDGLIDVDVPSPAAGQVLQYDGAIWKAVAIPNATEAARGLIELATAAEVAAGTDTVRAVTPATLQQYMATASPAPADASTTVKGITQYATAADVTAGTATKTVTADLLKTTNDTLTTATTNITTIQGQITTIQGQTVDASETAKGIVELATIAEVTAGTDTVRAVTPAGARAVYLPLDFTTLAVLP